MLFEFHPIKWRKWPEFSIENAPTPFHPYSFSHSSKTYPRTVHNRMGFFRRFFPSKVPIRKQKIYYTKCWWKHKNFFENSGENLLPLSVCWTFLSLYLFLLSLLTVWPKAVICDWWYVHTLTWTASHRGYCIILLPVIYRALLKIIIFAYMNCIP